MKAPVKVCVRRIKFNENDKKRISFKIILLNFNYYIKDIAEFSCSY